MTSVLEIRAERAQKKRLVQHRQRALEAMRSWQAASKSLQVHGFTIEVTGPAGAVRRMRNPALRYKNIAHRSIATQMAFYFGVSQYCAENVIRHCMDRLKLGARPEDIYDSAEALRDHIGMLESAAIRTADRERSANAV